MSANNTACPSWCTDRDELHPAAEGWTYHSTKLPAVEGVEVELSHFTDSDEGPLIFVNTTRDGDLSPAEAIELAVVLMNAASTITPDSTHAAGVAIVEHCGPVARRVWAIIEDELRQRQAVGL